MCNEICPGICISEMMPKVYALLHVEDIALVDQNNSLIATSIKHNE